MTRKKFSSGKKKVSKKIQLEKSTKMPLLAEKLRKKFKFILQNFIEKCFLNKFTRKNSLKSLIKSSKFYML